MLAGRFGEPDPVRGIPGEQAESAIQANAAWMENQYVTSKIPAQQITLYQPQQPASAVDGWMDGWPVSVQLSILDTAQERLRWEGDQPCYNDQSEA